MHTATSLVVDSSGQVLVSNPEIDPYNLYPENKGVIDSPADQDLFSFNAAAGQVDLTVNPAWDAFYRTSKRGANLDILVRLLDASGVTLATSNPTLDSYASISANVPGGVYYLAVSGVGSSNYSEYGSVGQYYISGLIPSGTPNALPNANFGFTTAGRCRDAGRPASPAQLPAQKPQVAFISQSSKSMAAAAYRSADVQPHRCILASNWEKSRMQERGK